MTENHRKSYCVLKVLWCVAVSGTLLARVAFAEAGENNVPGYDPSGSASHRLATPNAAQTAVTLTRNVRSTPTVLTAPTIGYARVGDDVVITAASSGPEPTGFQWYFDGCPISGATQSSIRLVNVQVTNAGTYTIFVTNANGFDMSTSCLNVDGPSFSKAMLTSLSPGDTNVQITPSASSVK